MRIYSSGSTAAHSTFSLPGAALYVAPFVAASALVIFLPNAVVRGYVFAYLSCLNIALGAMAVLLIWNLSGGHWGNLMVPSLRAMVATLPALALLTVPLWFSLNAIFPWVGADCEQLDVTAHQCLWLQPELQIVRSGIYWIAWLGIAAGMATWSLRQSLNRSSPRAAVSIIAFMLLTSMFAVDWFMTLIPRSSTTMIGFLLISEQLVAGLALAILMTTLGQWRNRCTKEQIKSNTDLGNLLLSAVMLHGYCLYMDYLIVWEANLPDEIIWYTERSTMFHGLLMWIVVILYIALPVILLLFRRVKGSARGLTFISSLLLAGHLILICWYLVPVLRRSEEPGMWPWDWMMAAGLISLWITTVVLLRRRSQVAIGVESGAVDNA